MDAEERGKRVLECLRRLDVGESISADGIADEIGEKLSDVYDAIEDLENAKLVEMFPAFRKGSDPTYTLSSKGKHAVSSMGSLELGKPDIVGAIPEPVVKAAPAPSADRVCRFCGKEMEQNKVRRHENLCGKNPDHVTRRPKHPEPEPVPAPSEYAEPESNAEATVEYETDILDKISAAEPNAHDEISDAEVIRLENSPGMGATLRLLNVCQAVVDSGADVVLDAHIKVCDGFYVNINLDLGAKE